MTARQLSYQDVFDLIQTVFPDDPDFIWKIIDELDTHKEKNADYAGGPDADPNGNFYRIAKILEQYPNLDLSDPRVVIVISMLKQFDQVLWSLSRGYEGTIEDLDSRMRDVGVYAKIFRVINDKSPKEFQLGA